MGTMFLVEPDRLWCCDEKGICEDVSGIKRIVSGCSGGNGTTAVGKTSFTHISVLGFFVLQWQLLPARCSGELQAVASTFQICVAGDDHLPQ